MASGSHQPTANAQSASPEIRWLDGELVGALYSQERRIYRIGVHIRTVAMLALLEKLPGKVQGTKEKARGLGELIRKVNEGIARIETSIQGFFPEPHVIAGRIEQEIKAFSKSLPVMEVPESEEPDPVATAIRDATNAIRETTAAFTIQALEDETLLFFSENVPSGKTFNVETFLDVPEDKPDQTRLSFDKTRGNDRLITDLWEDHAVEADAGPETGEVPAFRWSWTDDELFSERQVPRILNAPEASQMRSEINACLQKMSQGCLEWKKVAKEVLGEKGRLIDPASGQSVSIDTLLNENTFCARMETPIVSSINNRAWWSEEIDELIANIAKAWEPDVEILTKSTHNKVEFSISFMIDALRTLYDVYKHHSIEYQRAVLSNRHISQKNTYYLHTQPAEDFAGDSASMHEIFIKCQGRIENEQLKDTIWKCLNEKHFLESDENSNKRAAAGKAIAHLYNRLAKFAERFVDFSPHTSPELIKHAKSSLSDTLHFISELQFDDDLSELLAMEIKNVASFHISWNFRNAALYVPLMYSMDVHDKDYLDELAHFYPEQPASDEKTADPMEAKKNQWRAEVEAALPDLKNCFETRIILESDYEKLVTTGQWIQRFIDADAIDSEYTLRRLIAENIEGPLSEDEILSRSKVAAMNNKQSKEKILSFHVPEAARRGQLAEFELIPGDNMTSEDLKATNECLAALKKRMNESANFLAIDGLEYKNPTKTVPDFLMHEDRITTSMISVFASASTVDFVQQFWGRYALRNIPGYKKRSPATEALRAAVQQIFSDIKTGIDKPLSVTRNITTYEEARGAYEECLSIAQDATENAVFPPHISPDLAAKIRTVIFHIYHHQLAVRYQRLLSGWPAMRPADEKEYRSDPILKVLFETHTIEKHDAETAEPGKTELDAAFLGSLWSKVRDDAFGRLQIEKGNTSAKFENGARKELISTAKEAELQKLANTGITTTAQAKEYIACIGRIIEQIPREITIGKNTVAVSQEFAEHLRSQCDELSLHFAEYFPDGLAGSNEGTTVDRGQGVNDHNDFFFADPLADIVAKARVRRSLAASGSATATTGPTRQDSAQHVTPVEEHSSAADEIPPDTLETAVSSGTEANVADEEAALPTADSSAVETSVADEDTNVVEQATPIEATSPVLLDIPVMEVAADAIPTAVSSGTETNVVADEEISPIAIDQDSRDVEGVTPLSFEELQKEKEEREARERLRGPVLTLAKNICTEHICRFVCSIVCEAITGSASMDKNEVRAISDAQFKIAWMSRIAEVVDDFAEAEVVFEAEDAVILGKRISDVFIDRNPTIRIISRCSEVLRGDPAFMRYQKTLLELARNSRPDMQGLRRMIENPESPVPESTVDLSGIAYAGVLGHRSENLLAEEHHALRIYCSQRLGNDVSAMSDDAMTAVLATWRAEGSLERLANEINNLCSGGDALRTGDDIENALGDAIREWKLEQEQAIQPHTQQLGEKVQNLLQRSQALGAWIATWKDSRSRNEMSGRVVILEAHRYANFLLENRLAQTADRQPPDPLTVEQTERLIAHLEKAVPLVRKTGSSLQIDAQELAVWTRDEQLALFTISEEQEPDEQVDRLVERRREYDHQIQRIERQLSESADAPSRIRQITSEIAELDPIHGQRRNEDRLRGLRLEQLRLQELVSRERELRAELQSVHKKKALLAAGIDGLLSSLES